MNASTLESSAFAIDLDARQSSRTLERALRQRADISLSPGTALDDPPIIGPLAGRTEMGLLVEPQGRSPDGRVPLVSEYCEAAFLLDDARYLFTTHILEVNAGPRAWRLEIARPEQLQVVQRRRYQRRQLRGNTRVQINPAGEIAVPPLEVTLLNIGPGGLACRADRAEADPYGLNAVIEMGFSLPESDDPFQITGRLRSKTRGAGSEQIILTVEFTGKPEQDQEIERLVEALYGLAPALIRG